ncbi:uncharacterized protein LOC133790861 isoform X2 [Humulus lupulus]|uniref:uncharacterized protein LOC133790861 isoform X2 n=1 Tax=Humulus lupulus TaxID=3486 RepID=UPI002B409D93|nr:uncharacterized protein LOC133790861 isoform X2 [Humulus lupulus]
MADKSTPPIRLMNFISEDQLDETKKARGERVEDGTAQRDRPLFEILKENKDKKDAEFNERFKHRPPKALDDDETEFLDKLELSKREYEKQVACEEAQQLRNFQAAVAAQSMISQEFEETPPVPVVQVWVWLGLMEHPKECVLVNIRAVNTGRAFGARHEPGRHEHDTARKNMGLGQARHEKIWAWARHGTTRAKHGMARQARRHDTKA